MNCFGRRNLHGTVCTEASSSSADAAPKEKFSSAMCAYTRVYEGRLASYRALALPDVRFDAQWEQLSLLG